MEKFTNSKWFYVVLSLFFALLLYFNANNSTNDGGVTQEVSKQSDEYTEVINNLPIHLNYDKDKYFVSVSDNQVDVTLSSMNKVVLDAESNRQTRTFTAEVNLKNYTPGTYTVPIKIKGLNHSVKSQLSKQNVQVTIANRDTRDFKVTTNVDEKWVKKGMEISKITINPSEVSVSTSADDLNKIHHVVAYLSPQTNLSQSFTTTATLKAYSEKGEEVVAEFSKKQVTVTVDIHKPKKTVALNLIQKGKSPKNVSSYQFLCDTQSITIQGDKDEVDKISSLDVPIDVKDAKKTITRQVNLNLPKGIQSDTKSINVTIVPQLSHKS